MDGFYRAYLAQTAKTVVVKKFIEHCILQLNSSIFGYHLLADWNEGGGFLFYSNWYA